MAKSSSSAGTALLLTCGARAFFCDGLFPKCPVIWVGSHENRLGRGACCESVDTEVRRLLRSSGRRLAVVAVDEDMLAQFQKLGWQPWCYVVSKPVSDVAPQEREVKIREIQSGDLPWIKDQFCKAISLGLPEQLKNAYSPTDMKTMTIKRLNEISSADNLCIVAHVREKRIGYALTSFAHNYCHLHEVYSDRESGVHGCGEALSSFVAFASHLKKRPMLRGSVSVTSGNRPDLVWPSILGNGWKIRTAYATLATE